VNNLIFSINNLICSYSGNQSDTVLFIPKLEIERGKLIFLLGSSGSGKSTLLETLGLMNNTIAGGDVTLFASDGAAISYSSLWKSANKKDISAIRKQHFNFIFQNTNLMGNFTAYENVALSMMIKQNIHFGEVVTGASELMNRVKLPSQEVNENTLANNLSGGQKQRLAFVRALNSKADLLCCDEPTGNLDEANANELFEVIKSRISENSTAIVVSHDIDLALKHAEQIIVLTKNGKMGYGEILPENIFNRDEWSKSPDDTIRLKEKLKSFYSTTAEKLSPAVHENFSGRHSSLNLSYRALFYRREGKEMMGKAGVNFIVLAAILLFTFLAIGFANGSLNYLEKKMNDPFVRWITIPIPGSKADPKKVGEIKELLTDNLLQKEYDFSKVSSFSLSWINVRYFDSAGEYEPCQFRTSDFENDNELIKKDILSPAKLVAGDSSGFKSDKDIGIIVTEKYLSQLRYPVNTPFIYLEQDYVEDSVSKTAFMPVPVRAVVEQLPNRCDMLTTQFFAETWEANSDENFFEPIHYTSSISLLVEGNTKDVEKVYTILNKAKEEGRLIIKFVESFDNKGTFTETSIPAGLVDITFNENLKSVEETDKMYEAIQSLLNESITPNKTIRVYNYNLRRPANPNKYPDELSIYFNKLDRVREFNDFLQFDKRFNNYISEGKLEIDDRNVKEKENFNFLSKVTNIISFLLIVFSSIAICLFIFNLLKMHLSKVKMNIGTLKAIGLGNREAMNIYFYIILSFVCAALLLSFSLAFGIGSLLDVAYKSNAVADIDINYFTLFDWKTLLTIIVIMVSTIGVSWFTINRILYKSPGDLIYNR